MKVGHQVKFKVIVQFSMQNSINGPNLLNILSLGVMVSDKRILKDFSYITLCKTGDPKGGANFDPRGII